MTRRLLAPFFPSSQPLMARPSYRRELLSASTFSVALALLEGGVIGVLGRYVFHVGNLGFALVVAAPMFANITSPLWARLSRARPKIPFICTLMSVVLAVNVAIASLPTGAVGAALLVSLVVLARCMLAGVVTVRSNVWRTNYRRDVRARIAGRFLLVTTFFSALAPLVGYVIQDLDTVFFRLTYGVSAAIGLIGVLGYAGIRLRHERGQLAFERPAGHAAGRAEAELGHASESEANSSGKAESAQTPCAESISAKAASADAGSTHASAADAKARRADGRPHTALSVLSSDRRFSQYMVCQFVAGASNMMGETAMLRYVVKVFEGYRFEKALAVLLNASLPLVILMLTLPLWAKLLDRNHIATYRTRHGLFWMLTQAMNFVVAATGMLWLLPLSRILQGTMMGGGRIAFNLGHNDFADRRLVSLYMGIHQTLAGIRGCIFPFAGVFLLMGWERTDLWLFTLPAWPGIGAGVFLITTSMAVVGYLGFYRLHRQLHRTAGGVTLTD